LLVESKLGLANVRAGATKAGLEMILGTIQRRPEQAELHDRLILSYVWLGRGTDAAAAAEEKLRCVRLPQPEDFRRAAALWASVGDWKRSAAVLHVGLLVYPSNGVLKEALAELLANAGINVNDMLERLTVEVQLTAST
jgi:hypothetical protein